MAALPLDAATSLQELCYKLHLTNEILMVAQELLVGCKLILRVLALYLFNKRGRFNLDFCCNNRPRCGRGFAAAWEAQLAGDILLVGFTLYHGYKRSRRGILAPDTLWQILVRDGESPSPLSTKFLLDPTPKYHMSRQSGQYLHVQCPQQCIVTHRRVNPSGLPLPNSSLFTL
ncbi:hypothetical protein B0H14DRAFT_2580692 [Mycena olivaceomarginata]|nr:hypothetical protein B0H14DRAFT_2580692 [Mycena olivaceomarginata]